MIYVFQVPCDICKHVCGGACKCMANLCAELPGACERVGSALESAGELIGNFISSLTCLRDHLGGLLLMSCVVNGIATWDAVCSLQTRLVKECTETFSFGSMDKLMKTDIVFAIIHVVFVLYLRLRISQQMKREEENAGKTIGESVAAHRSVVELMKRDFGVC